MPLNTDVLIRTQEKHQAESFLSSLVSIEPSRLKWSLQFMLDILLSSLLNLAVIIPQNSGIVNGGFEAPFIIKQMINPLSPVVKEQPPSNNPNDPIVPPN